MLVEEWTAVSPGAIWSNTVYYRLIAEGEEIPAGEMDSLFTLLKHQGYLRGSRMSGKSAISQHGNFAITWVDPSLRPRNQSLHWRTVAT